VDRREFVPLRARGESQGRLTISNGPWDWGADLTPVEREALELAANRCVGHYTTEHIDAWALLAEEGLVRHVRSETGAWYEITDAGREALAKGRPLARDPAVGPVSRPRPRHGVGIDRRGPLGERLERGRLRGGDRPGRANWSSMARTLTKLRSMPPLVGSIHLSARATTGAGIGGWRPLRRDRLQALHHRLGVGGVRERGEHAPLVDRRSRPGSGGSTAAIRAAAPESSPAAARALAAGSPRIASWSSWSVIGGPGGGMGAGREIPMNITEALT
jgi:hypothetical protein